MPDIQTATHGPIDVDGMPLNSQPFLTGAPVSASAAPGVAGSAISVTLPGAVGLTTYIEGFIFVVTPPTAFAGPIFLTIAGLAGGTMNWPTLQQMTGAEIYVQQNFPTPRPASATNTGIVLSYAALANGGVPLLMAWGFQA